MKYDRIIKKIERFKIADASGGGREIGGKEKGIKSTVSNHRPLPTAYLICENIQGR